MGILNIFGRRSWRMREFQDLVWLTPAAKHEGVVRDLQRRWHKAQFHLVVAWFRETLERVEDCLAKHQLPMHPLAGPLSTEEWEQRLTAIETPQVITLLADWLPDLNLQGNTWALPNISLTVAERHFLPACDQQIVNFLIALPCKTALQFHVALTDPLLENFAGPQTRETLTSLGLPDDEALRMRSLSRRIQHAQRHFARMFQDQHLAESATFPSAQAWLSAHNITK